MALPAKVAPMAKVANAIISFPAFIFVSCSN
jgi:hypothetical protein